MKETRVTVTIEPRPGVGRWLVIVNAVLWGALIAVFWIAGGTP